jgi:hypothetical protein
MLKRFLPERKPKQLNSQNQSPDPQAEEAQDKIPDLLQSYNEEFNPTTKSDRPMLNFLRFVIVVGILSYLVVWVIGLRALDRIEGLEESITSLTAQNMAYRQVEADANRLTKKIEHYKSVEARRYLIGNKISYAEEVLPANVEIQGFSYNEGVLSIQAAAPSALIFSLVISRYLEGGFVSEIFLKSAEYVPQDDVYKVSMDLVLSN